MKARLHSRPVMTIHRRILRYDRMVYLLVSKRGIHYSNGRSGIAYIGTTSEGIDRVATSVAFRAADVLSGRGVSSFDVYIVTCPPKKKVRTWLLLERALLAQFLADFHELPSGNTNGKHARWTPVLDRLFTRTGIDKILNNFR